MRVEGDERDTQRFCLLLRADRRGDCHDVLQLAALEQLPKAFHCQRRSNASTRRGGGGGREGRAFFFVACLTRLTTNHASLSRRSTVRQGRGGGGVYTVNSEAHMATVELLWVTN